VCCGIVADIIKCSSSALAGWDGSVWLKVNRQRILDVALRDLVTTFIGILHL